jgi:PIN domain nuclease of toxin-antitoxin system
MTMVRLWLGVGDETRQCAVTGRPAGLGKTIVRGTELAEAPFTAEAALELPFVQLPHKEPGDRCMVATARAYNLTLVTDDSKILAGEQYLQLQFLPNR